MAGHARPPRHRRGGPDGARQRGRGRAGRRANLVLVGDPQQLAQPIEGLAPARRRRVGARTRARPVSRRSPTTAACSSTRRGGCTPTSASSSPISPTSPGSPPHPNCSGQRVAGDDALGGSGVRWIPVEHAGNKLGSDEEVAAVRDCLDSLIGREWVDFDGVVVADHAATTSWSSRRTTCRSTCCIDALPDGARVGTVDKFQGQEAAVAIVSMATSSAADAAARPGVPAQHEPPQRRRLAGAGAGHRRRQPDPADHGVQVAAPDPTRQRPVPLRRARARLFAAALTIRPARPADSACPPPADR